LADMNGVPLAGADHAIYTRVSLVVARPDVNELVTEALRETICPAFAQGAK
jgi:hypothetical protein